MNKLIITGYVGIDPIEKIDQGGVIKYVSFTVGVQIGTKSSPKVFWVNVKCKNKLSEIAQKYIHKGDKLLIEGFPGVHPYLDKEGNPAASLYVYANNIEFLSSNKQSDIKVDYAVNDNKVMEDDIPF